MRDLLATGRHVLIMDVDIIVVRDVAASLAQVFGSMYGSMVDMLVMRVRRKGACWP